MAEHTEKLFDMFPAVSAEEWRAKVDADLKGVPFEKKLVWRTNEGFNVNPMYRREDIADLKTTESLPGEFPYVRGTRTNNDWFIRQEIIADNAVDANTKAKDALERGATSLGWHMPEVTAEALATFLAGIDLTKVEINLSCCMRRAEELTSLLVDYVESVGAAEAFRGSIKFNPFKRELKHGTKAPIDGVAAASAMIRKAAGVKGLRLLSVDSAMLTNGGAYIYQELGYALKPASVSEVIHCAPQLSA